MILKIVYIHILILIIVLSICKYHNVRMSKDMHQYKSHCPINYAQEIFGDRWCLLIIRDLLLKDKKYYGEFLESKEGISTNILADRLKKLQRMGLINKREDKANKSRFIYTLTEKGVDLLPMLLEMIIWGAKYDVESEAPKELIEAIKKDREALINALRSKIIR